MQVSLTPRAERWSPQGRGAFTYCPLLGSIPAAGREKRGQSPPPRPDEPPALLCSAHARLCALS